MVVIQKNQLLFMLMAVLICIMLDTQKCLSNARKCPTENSRASPSLAVTVFEVVVILNHKGIKIDIDQRSSSKPTRSPTHAISLLTEAYKDNTCLNSILKIPSVHEFCFKYLPSAMDNVLGSGCFTRSPSFHSC